MTPKVKLGLLLVLALATFTLSCHRRITYQDCVDKYGSTNTVTTDTITVSQTDTVRVAGESVALETKTDTTYETNVARQGRAIVTYMRTPKTTYVKADCLPVYYTVTRKIPVSVVNTTNVFKRAPTGWRNAFWIALIVGVIGWLAFYLRR